jgi:hypothetical protein
MLFTCLISGGAASGSAKSGLSSISTSTASSSSVKVSSCSQSSPDKQRLQNQAKMHAKLKSDNMGMEIWYAAFLFFRCETVSSSEE